MPTIKTTDGVELYVKQWGTGDRVLVLAHGWPLTADSWDGVAMPLSEAGWRVVAYDRRGFGRSEQPVGGYDYAHMVDDFAAVVQWTGAAKVAIGGFSMGGGEVAGYVRKHGAKVSHAILISSIVPYMLKTKDNPDGVPEAGFAEMRTGIIADRAQFMRDFAPSFYGNGWLSKSVSQGVLDHFFAMAMMAGLKATVDCVTAFGTTDFRDALPAFTMPTLVVHGTADKTVPIDPSGKAVAKAVPHAVFKKYDGAHGLFATHRDELVADIIAFLNG